MTVLCMSSLFPYLFLCLFVLTFCSLSLTLFDRKPFSYRTTLGVLSCPVVLVRLSSLRPASLLLSVVNPGEKRAPCMQEALCNPSR